MLQDEPEVYRNTPISLQGIGIKGEDEAVVEMTEIIDAALEATKVGRLAKASL